MKRKSITCPTKQQRGKERKGGLLLCMHWSPGAVSHREVCQDRAGVAGWDGAAVVLSLPFYKSRLQLGSQDLDFEYSKSL